MKNVFDILDELDNRYENKDWSINEAIELAIEETSKAKDKEFINILNDLQDDVDALQKDYTNLDECEKIDVYELIEEIKQKIKENKE